MTTCRCIASGSHWGSRVTLTELRGVEIIGNGDGIVLANELKDSTVQGKYWKATNEGLNGEFFTGTTIWGGHIYVQGRALVIGDGVWVTTVVGTYLDIGPGGGVVMEYGAQWLRLINANLDLSPAAKRAKAPKISAASKKEAKSIKFVGTSVGREDVRITGKKN